MKKTGDTYDYTVGNKRFSYTIWEDEDGKLYIRRDGQLIEMVKKYGKSFNFYVVKGGVQDTFDALPENAQERLISFAKKSIYYLGADPADRGRMYEARLQGYAWCLADMGLIDAEKRLDICDEAWERAGKANEVD